jgi:hypothetical protein
VESLGDVRRRLDSDIGPRRHDSIDPLGRSKTKQGFVIGRVDVEAGVGQCMSGLDATLSVVMTR